MGKKKNKFNSWSITEEEQMKEMEEFSKIFSGANLNITDSDDGYYTEENDIDVQIESYLDTKKQSEKNNYSINHFEKKDRTKDEIDDNNGIRIIKIIFDDLRISLNRIIIDDGAAPTNIQLDAAVVERITQIPSIEKSAEIIETIIDYIVSLSHPAAIFKNEEIIQHYSNIIDCESYNESKFKFYTFDEEDVVYAYIIDTESIGHFLNYMHSEYSEKEFYSILVSMGFGSGIINNAFFATDKDFLDVMYDSDIFNKKNEFYEYFTNDKDTVLENSNRTSRDDNSNPFDNFYYIGDIIDVGRHYIDCIVDGGDFDNFDEFDNDIEPMELENPYHPFLEQVEEMDDSEDDEEDLRDYFTETLPANVLSKFKQTTNESQVKIPDIDKILTDDNPPTENTVVVSKTTETKVMVTNNTVNNADNGGKVIESMDDVSSNNNEEDTMTIPIIRKGGK